ncbi:hypothetical protein Glove_232g51 [Diversispora epigaea]|uniref:Uncharacterized protein n=1 Tax=Diversispora epigaea TaxID=1348612 RepID=A0A397IJ76_9GLOM|nr:hypothetical protein Glove_232g51 [Diversispora epigaea]
MRYMMEEFWKRAASPFSGIVQDFKLFELDLEELCPAIFRYLTGYFGESRYLLMRIRGEFEDKVKSIIVSRQPQAAIVRTWA